MNILLSVCLLLASVFQTQETPRISDEVVLMSGDYADPSILKDGEDYYLTHSPFHYQPGFLIWHSKDLFNWEPICRAGDDWTGSAWAPDLQKVGDTYYIYFPAEETNWVITAKDIRGPWTKPVDLKIGGIDPGLIVTPEGKRYLFTNMGQVTPLTDDGLARAGQTVQVYDGWEYPREWQTECMCLESPKLTYHNGYYYMTSAEGGTAGPATSHMAVCARSKSIYGPWENSPYNPIIHTYSADEQWWSKGHGTIVEGPDGQWWIVYHSYNKTAYSLGRYTLMEPIEWTRGGWYRTVKDLVCQNPVVLPDLSDTFSSSTLGWQWTGWKENVIPFAKIQKGVLSLLGKGASPKDGRLLLTTATDPCYDVQVSVSVAKKGCEAGMLLFYNEDAFAGIAFDTKMITIYQHGSLCKTLPNTLGRTIDVRLENRCNRLDILARSGNGEWQTLCSGLDVSDYHHNKYGGFIALRPALYVSGSAKADFTHFIYNKRQ